MSEKPKFYVGVQVSAYSPKDRVDVLVPPELMTDPRLGEDILRAIKFAQETILSKKTTETHRRLVAIIGGKGTPTPPEPSGDKPA
jgi:hypothetical protein